jgi:hypothetical protein
MEMREPVNVVAPLCATPNALPGFAESWSGRGFDGQWVRALCVLAVARSSAALGK